MPDEGEYYDRLEELAAIKNTGSSFRNEGLCETIVNGELFYTISVRTHEDTEFVTIKIGDSSEILVTKSQYPKLISILSSFSNKGTSTSIKKSVIKG